MYKKLLSILSSLMITLTMTITPIHAYSVHTSGDGFNIIFSITDTTVSAAITGEFSSGASVMIVARYMNVDGVVSDYQYRTSSPYTSISLSEMPMINDKPNKCWYEGKAIGYPTSLTYTIETTWSKV